MPRSSFYYTTKRRGPVALDAALTTLVRAIIEANPTFGVRRITVVLRRQVNRQINRNAVHRIIRHHGWQVWQKPQGKRPRMMAWPSRAAKPNARAWLERYDQERPHSALGYLTPKEYREKLAA